VILGSFESLAVARVPVVQLEMAVDAKPEKLEKELIAHVGVSEMVDMLNGCRFATGANALLPFDYLSSEFLPLAGVNVSMVFLAPLRVFRLARIHGKPMDANYWILGHGRKKAPKPIASETR
jgi:hypothetical protein